MNFRPESGCRFWGCAVFFSRGSPRFGGGPLDLPWGASGRLGGDFPADGPPSSQPAWGDPPVHPLHPHLASTLCIHPPASTPCILLLHPPPASTSCIQPLNPPTAPTSCIHLLHPPPASSSSSSSCPGVRVFRSQTCLLLFIVSACVSLFESI